ncbi:hypothetical protein Tco_0115710 [Tanacetum coccineum]
MVAWIMECVATTSFSISINRSLHGHFKGKRGLRQGDPLSPYLFTLVMEVLMLMLQRRVWDSNQFTYHRYCSKLDLINLCFSDDLFLFAHGDVNSAMVIKEALDEFKCASGLIPSLPKSTAYFCNVLNFTKLAILQILPFENGRLSVKYLGVPLVSSRLIFRDCKELIEKVQNCINDWKNKSLSIAGRIQLIQSVLGGVSKGKAKVSWEVVCLPKDEGGLGYSLSWHHVVGMAEDPSVASSCSGVFWHNIGDGSRVSLWFDRWCHNGLLSTIVSTRDMFRGGFTLSSTVQDAIRKGSWLWPHEWMVKYPLLNNISVPILVAGKCDCLEWRDVAGAGQQVSVQVVWNYIRLRDVKVLWFELVWFRNYIPRHAVNLWLIIKRRLKTQDLLRSWDVAAGIGLVLFESICGDAICGFIDVICYLERNRRLFKGNKHSVQEIIECTMTSIRRKLLSFRFKKSNDGVLFARLWDLPEAIFK